MKKIIILGSALLLAVVIALFVKQRVFAGTNAAATVQTVPVSRGNIQSTVLSSAALQPAADLNLTFGSAGTLTTLNVKPGDKVTKGQALAALDPGELNLAVVQAQATLDSARAKLDSVKAGATSSDIANAQDAVRSAQAKLDSLKVGPTTADLASAEAGVTAAQAKLKNVMAGSTPQDIANAQSALVSAQAKLDSVKAGSTPQDIANARSALVSAKAKLVQLKAPPTAEDLANAQSTLKSAQAKLDQLKQPASAGDLTAAESSLKSAQAKLAALTAGPTTAQLSAAQLKVTQAQTSFAKTQSSASLSKQSDDISMQQSLNALQDAQDAYRAVAADALDGNGNLITVFPRELAGKYGSLQGLVDQYNSKKRAMEDAQGALKKAQLSYDDSRQQEAQAVTAAKAQLDDASKQLADLIAGPTTADLTSAQAAVDSAQNSLDKLKQGATQADLTAAQATVDQAQNALNKLKEPPVQADLTAAQATVDQAQNSLDKLLAGPAASDVTQAQAAVDQAQNNLAKLKAGPTQADITAAQSGVASAQASLAKLKAPASAADLAAAQAAVNQAQNSLDKLKAGPLATDLETAQAGVDQAQANLESARLKVTQANMTAPFDGVVASVPVATGQSVSASTTVVELVDSSLYHLDMNVGEADISQIKDGEPVEITFDALSGTVYTGTVTFVAPNATVSQGVVNYLATVTLDPKAADSNLRPGMSATASVVVAERDNVLMVPSRAIRSQGSQKIVYVVGPNASQIPVQVQTGFTNDTSTEIVGNTVLREGDNLVVNTPTSTTSTAGQPNRGGLINLGGGGGGLRGGAGGVDTGGH
ncbi:MAG: efflux RND transporter periplasmic adaptor subunit [Chloroflexi bacterium]|nr:efflux RND transporter periplasmic adaptor subunit [Chloroflexota bacterium]